MGSKQTEDLNLNMSNMITGINELKTFTKHISCECKCNLDGTKCNSNQWWNNNKCWCECKKVQVCEKGYVWNPATCNCENGKHSASIADDSAIICDKVIESYEEEIKTISTNFNEKNITCKAQNLYILLAFLLTTIAILIAVSIYCYLIIYQAKRRHLHHFTTQT